MLLQPDGELQAFQTLSARQPIQVADLSKAPSYLARNPKAVNSVEIGGIRTMVTVPMLKDGEAIGVITIFRTEVHELTEKQISLVTNFAAQAVIAIENTRLLNELRELLEQQTATSEVLGVISSSPGDLEPVFQAMMANATRICDAKFGILQLHENGKFRNAAMFNPPPALAEYRHREPVINAGPQSAIGRVAATKQLVHIVDYAADPAYIQRDPAAVNMVERAGARTVLLVPMLKDGEHIGNLNIYRQAFAPSPTSRSRWYRTSPPRPSSPSRTRGYSTNCGSAPTIWRSCWSGRPPRRRSCRSSVRRPAHCSRCFTRCSRTPREFAKPRSAYSSLREGDFHRVVAMHNAPPAYADLRTREPVWKPSGTHERHAGRGDHFQARGAGR